MVAICLGYPWLGCAWWSFIFQNYCFHSESFYFLHITPILWGTLILTSTSPYYLHRTPPSSPYWKSCRITRNVRSQLGFFTHSLLLGFIHTIPQDKISKLSTTWKGDAELFIELLTIRRFFPRELSSMEILSKGILFHVDIFLLSLVFMGFCLREFCPRGLCPDTHN